MRREGRQRTPLVRVGVGVRVRFIALKNISHFKSRHIAFSYPEEKDQKPKKTTSVKKRFSGVDTEVRAGAVWWRDLGIQGNLRKHEHCCCFGHF